MGSFVARIFIYDGNYGTPWQALFWVGLVVCIGLGAFYAVVWMSGSGPASDIALRGMIGCAKGLGAVLFARALAWVFASSLGL